jgi:hypothetical protein
MGLAAAKAGLAISMALVSIAVGSVLTTRMGARRASLLIYTTYTLLALFVLRGQSLWVATTAFIAMSCVWSLHDTMTSICTNPLRMQLSDPKVAATQFDISAAGVAKIFGILLGVFLFACLVRAGRSLIFGEAKR